MGDDERQRKESAPAADPATENIAGALTSGTAPAPTPTWLGRRVSPEHVADFFAAAAALWRAAPWRLAPDAAAALSVSSEALILEDVVTVGERDGTDRALRFFRGFDDFERHARLAATDADGALAAAPPYLTLAFVHAEALAPSLREEVEHHGWEIAADEAWPLLRDEESGADIVSPTAIELESVEGAVRALAAALAEPEPLRAALAGGAPYAREFDIVCGGDAADVTIGAPVVPPPERSLSGAELIARAIGTLGAGRDDDTSPEAATWRAETELLRRFAVATEPPPTRETLAYCRFALESARDRFGCHLVELDVDELRKLLLESAPRELDVAPPAAYRVVEVLRAFLAFLERETGVTRAAAVASLDDDTVSRLEEALADPSVYGPGKLARMAVREAGLEPGSDEARIVWASAFERALRARIDADDVDPLPDLPSSPRRPSPAERKARKKSRKAARKARRKNR